MICVNKSVVNSYSGGAEGGAVARIYEEGTINWHLNLERKVGQRFN